MILFNITCLISEISACIIQLNRSKVKFRSKNVGIRILSLKHSFGPKNRFIYVLAILQFCNNRIYRYILSYN